MSGSIGEALTSGSLRASGINGTVQFGDDLPVRLANQDKLLFLAAAIRMLAPHSFAEDLLDLPMRASSWSTEDDVRIHDLAGILPEDSAPRLPALSLVGGTRAELRMQSSRRLLIVTSANLARKVSLSVPREVVLINSRRAIYDGMRCAADAFDSVFSPPDNERGGRPGMIAEGVLWLEELGGFIDFAGRTCASTRSAVGPSRRAGRLPRL